MLLVLWCSLADCIPRFKVKVVAILKLILGILFPPLGAGIACLRCRYQYLGSICALQRLDYLRYLAIF